MYYALHWAGIAHLCDKKIAILGVLVTHLCDITCRVAMRAGCRGVGQYALVRKNVSHPSKPLILDSEKEVYAFSSNLHIFDGSKLDPKI